MRVKEEPTKIHILMRQDIYKSVRDQDVKEGNIIWEVSWPQAQGRDSTGVARPTCRDT